MPKQINESKLFSQRARVRALALAVYRLLVSADLELLLPGSDRSRTLS
jgi:hypothetical protein